MATSRATRRAPALHGSAAVDGFIDALDRPARALIAGELVDPTGLVTWAAPDRRVVAWSAGDVATVVDHVRAWIAQLVITVPIGSSAGRPRVRRVKTAVRAPGKGHGR